MQRQKAIRLALAVLAAAALSCCPEGIAGSTASSRQVCSTNAEGGSCEGGFGRLSGGYWIDVETDAGGADSVFVEVDVSVDEGPIRVYVEAPDGGKTSTEARPGQPATLSGQAEVSFDEFQVYFEALEGEAEGISYSLTYTYP